MRFGHTRALQAGCHVHRIELVDLTVILDHGCGAEHRAGLGGHGHLAIMHLAQQSINVMHSIGEPG